MEAIEAALDLLKGPSMLLGPFSLASSAQPHPLPGTVPAQARHEPTLEVLPDVLMFPLPSIDTPSSNLETYSGHQSLPLLPEVSPDITPVLFFSPATGASNVKRALLDIGRVVSLFSFVCLFCLITMA